jgi:hypothetical protein
MRWIARVFLLSLLVPCVVLAAGEAAFASVDHRCTGSSCSVGVGLPAAPVAGGSGGALTLADPKPRGNGIGRSSSGPCPSGQIATYQIQTQGGRPVTAQPGDVNPITLQPVAAGSELEVVYCNGNYLTTLTIPPGAAGLAVARLSSAQLARQAFARFRVAAPTPVLSPSTAVVNYLTWLWLGGGWLKQSATAAVPGLSATVTAAPSKVVWSMGDGGQVVCAGPGIPWKPTDPNGTTNCSYTYRTAGKFTASVTVYYQASWSASDGTAGQLGTVIGQTTLPVTVDEIQAVNTK